MNTTALKELLYKMADDQLIMGHRSSEWIGLGPLLEEDIAFASKAQDKVGQSLALYQLLEELGEADPDTVAFSRPATEFHNSIFTELPNEEFDFSIMRHFLFDTAEYYRFELLSDSTYEPLQQVARKFTGEIRYHILHANEWIKELGDSTEEAIARMQSALDKALPYALGVFEPSPYEQKLIDSGLFAGEQALQNIWQDKISEIIGQTALRLPAWESIEPVYGGRAGHHSEHLQPLLDEMGQVINSEPGAEW